MDTIIWLISWFLLFTAIMQDDAPAFRKKIEDLGVNEHHVGNLVWIYIKNKST